MIKIYSLLAPGDGGEQRILKIALFGHGCLSHGDKVGHR